MTKKAVAKKNPQDTTLRNLRATKKVIQAAVERLVEVADTVKALTARVDILEARLPKETGQ